MLGGLHMHVYVHTLYIQVCYVVSMHEAGVQISNRQCVVYGVYCVLAIFDTYSITEVIIAGISVPCIMLSLYT